MCFDILMEWYGKGIQQTEAILIDLLYGLGMWQFSQLSPLLFAYYTLLQDFSLSWQGINSIVYFATNLGSVKSENYSTHRSIIFDFNINFSGIFIFYHYKLRLNQRFFFKNVYFLILIFRTLFFPFLNLLQIKCTVKILFQ